MLEVKNLTKYYGNKKNKIIAFENISFKLKTGEITSLLGLNGAGKSSIINCISGYCRPNSGSILVDGFSIFKNEIEAKRKIGILYEQPPVYRYMSVYDFLIFSAKMHCMGKDVIGKAVKDALDFCELEEVEHRLISGLSKGYKQRVGLAQAILHNPPMVILDEPLSGLDAVQMKLFEKKILQIAKEKTILISTHNLKQAALICSNHILLNKGTIISKGDLQEIRESITASGGECNDNNNVLEQAFYFFAGVNKNEFGKIINE